MPGVLLLHAHHRHAVGTALWRQVEIDDLRELFLQDRHEHLVQGHAEDRRFVRRATGIGAVVDRLLPMGDALDGEDREALHLVVVAGVIAEGPLRCGIVREQMALQYELRRGGHLQI